MMVEGWRLSFCVKSSLLDVLGLRVYGLLVGLRVEG